MNKILEQDLTSLIIASELGNFDIIRKLLNRGADVNHKEEDGTTLLYIASKKWSH